MPLLIGLVALAVIACLIYSFWATAKRKKELAAWAASKGLSYVPDEDGGMDTRYPEFRCLQQGDHRYAFNLMRGQWGQRPLEAFDYHYETHSTDSKGRRATTHHYFSAVILDSPVPLKPLLIRPEGFLDKVTEFFGFDDIDFESAEFSRRFYVKAADKRWAYDVLHQRTMEFMLAMPVFHLQFAGRAVIVHHDAGKFDLREFEAASQLAAGILDRLPEYVVKQQSGPPPLSNV